MRWVVAGLGMREPGDLWPSFRASASLQSRPPAHRPPGLIPQQNADNGAEPRRGQHGHGGRKETPATASSVPGVGATEDAERTLYPPRLTG